MDQQKLSLTHLLHTPSVEEEGTSPLLLLLHGFGSNERDLFELVPYLDKRFLIVSARGPVTLQIGSYAWFMTEFTPKGPVINPAQAEESRKRLIGFIGEIIASYKVDPQRIYLMGFSQGAIISASVVLTQPELVTGVVMMSGRILPEIKPQLAPQEKLQDFPFLVVHGVTDAVLPIHHGRESRETLTELGVALDYREYSMGHEVSRKSLADVTTWLTTHLDKGI